MIEPNEFWENPEKIKIACYEWVPERVKFILYLVHGYADHSNAYPKLIKRINEIGGAVYSHEHFAHGKSGPYEPESPIPSTSSLNCHSNSFKSLVSILRRLSISLLRRSLFDLRS